MKKKPIVLSLFLLISLLCGCSCKHEWTEADCITPQICTKCEETGAAALGHDWSAATCTAPETCTRCAQTQGEPLGHSFGDWTFGETDMTHCCTVCGLEETAELDRGLYLGTLLEGLWEVDSMEQGDSTYLATQLLVPEWLRFGADRSVAGVMNTDPFDGTWEFDEFEEFPEEGSAIYRFSIHDKDQSRSIPMAFAKGSTVNMIVAYYSDDVIVWMSRNDDLAAKITGTWESHPPYEGSNLTFHEDRTVTGNLDGPIDGTWQLTGVYESPWIGRYSAIFITIRHDGEEVILQATITPDEDDDPASEFIPAEITVRTNDKRYKLYP